MTALDNLLAGKPSSAGVSTAAPKASPSGAPLLTPKVASAQQALATQTAKVRANFKSQARQPGVGSGGLDHLLNKATSLQNTGSDNTGFQFSWNPLKTIGSIAQNVPAVGALLEAIDTPRAVVTSAVKELAVDPTTGHGGPSLSDFVNQIKPGNHVGFGQLEEQANPNQNEWVKRLIGLTGDVAADPLTYAGVGLVGDTGKLAKGLATADRVELAKAVASQAERGVKGATDEAISTVARKGVTGLSPELQRTLGMRPTLTAGGVAIPGTEPLAAGIRKVTGAVRQVAGDTVLGRAARAVASKESERKLLEEAVAGGDKSATAVKALESVDQMKAVSRQFGKVHGADLTKILGSMSKEELATLPQQLEAGVTEGAAGQARQWLDNVLVEANKRGANLNKFENYYPHALTPDAAEAMAKEGIVKGRAPGGAIGPELLRKYKPGEDFMGHTLTQGSTSEVNAIAKEKLGYDLFSNNPAQVLPNYLKAVQGAVARGTYANRLVDHGVGASIVPKAEKFATTEAPTGGLAPAVQSVDHANAVATMDMGSHVNDPAPLAASIDNTAKAADLVRARPQRMTDAEHVALRAEIFKVQEAKDLLATHAANPDPQIRANAILEASAQNAEARLTLTGDTLTEQEMSHFLHSPQARTIIADQVQRGFTEISKGVAVPDWLAEARQVNRALTPAGYKGFLDAYDKFSQLWKAGATMSPGFHVRNTYSHAFNNFVAGVSTSAYADEFRLAKLAAKDGLQSEADKAAWDYVEKVVSATGHPFSSAEIGTGLAAKGKKVLGAPGRASRTVGTFVQDRLRGAMALDSFKAGEDLTSAISRVQRFHFNYNDISNFDRAAKRIIPFWMWTSRNLPLQLQMIIRRPAAYNKFMSLQRNLSLGVPQDQVVPSYFKEVGAFPVDIPFPGGEGTKYAAPELGFLRAQGLLDQIQDPVRLLSNANPLIKLPIEHIAGKKLFNDVPFKPGYQDLPGALSLPGIKQALEVLGVAKQGAKGPMTTDEAMYALESLIPAEGRVRRLAPTEDQYTERWPTSVASFLGANSLTNTPAAQEGELYRRKRALDAFVKQQQALGYYPKAKSTAPKPHPFGK